MNFKRQKVLFIASITLNVIFVLFFVGKRVYYGNYIFFNPEPNRVEKLLSEKPDAHDIVFLGTSLTYSLPLEAFKNPHIKNCGLAGSTTLGLLTELQKITQRHPEKIFLEAGINDIRKRLNSDNAYNNISNMLDTAKRISPKTTVYFQSILPTDSGYYNKKIIALNDRVALLCKARGVVYINLYNSFLKQGELNKDFTIDGVHLNEIGYYVWRKSVESYL